MIDSSRVYLDRYGEGGHFEADYIRCANVDVPLLRKHLEWAEAEAAAGTGRWNQKFYARLAAGQEELTCESSFCVAGNIIFEHGDLFVLPVNMSSYIRYCLTKESGEEMFIETRARQLIGISHYAAEHLFDEHNTIEDLRVIAEAIAGEKL